MQTSRKVLSTLCVISTCVFLQNWAFSATWSLELYPVFWTFWLYCREPITLRASTNLDVTTLDAKLFFNPSEVQLTWFTPIHSGNFFSPHGFPTTWSSLSWMAWFFNFYPVWSPYLYLNRFEPDPLQRLQTNSLSVDLGLRYIKNNYLVTWSKFEFYRQSWRNGDDSSLQSRWQNIFYDILTQAGTGSYIFVPTPCIKDTIAPQFTWFISGEVIDIGIQTWFSTIIFDRTGLYQSWLNSTYHYGRVTGDTSDLSNYQPVWAASGIDNQNGIISWTIAFILSGLSLVNTWTSGVLLSPEIATWWRILCQANTPRTGSMFTRNQKPRSYYCFFILQDFLFRSNQYVNVQLIATDFPDIIFNTNNTWTINFPIRIEGITVWNFLIIAWPEKKRNDTVTFISWWLLQKVAYDFLTPAEYSWIYETLFSFLWSWWQVIEFLSWTAAFSWTLAQFYESTVFSLYFSWFSGAQVPTPLYTWWITYYHDEYLSQTGNRPPNLFNSWVLEFHHIDSNDFNDYSSGEVTVNSLGISLFSGLSMHTLYDIWYKSYGHLRRIIRNITLTTDYQVLDFTSGWSLPLVAWDFQNDNKVDSFDLGLMIPLDIGVKSYDMDINSDGRIDSFDVGIFIGNYGKLGDEF